MVREDESTGINSPEEIEQRQAEQMINRANLEYARGSITEEQYKTITHTYKPKLHRQAKPGPAGFGGIR
jgi:uncharacterized membrane protein